ncbi:hypothetical protein K227x_45740 [Rubripirellula lacrimiformis]|uniref:Uncharacterized protein n=1 Tax=Rubripirellula lacrimiformis TaxID=1930273 RepID=A0A517NGA6_9BACT|nr:hypothetical protein K227x_45740 [Rubripirellula lacrimiformis]
MIRQSRVPNAALQAGEVRSVFVDSTGRHGCLAAPVLSCHLPLWPLNHPVPLPSAESPKA